MRFLMILLLSTVLLAVFLASAAAQAPAATAAPPTEQPAASPVPPLPPPAPPRMPPPMSARAINPASILLLSNMGVLGGAGADLTAEQKTNVQMAQKGLEIKMATLSSTVLAATKRLVEAIQADGTTPAKITELTAGVNKAEADIVQARLDFILALKEALTPEQFKTVMELVNRRLEAPTSPLAGMGSPLPAAPPNKPARPAGAATPAGTPAAPAAPAPPAHP